MCARTKLATLAAGLCLALALVACSIGSDSGREFLEGPLGGTDVGDFITGIASEDRLALKRSGRPPASETDGSLIEVQGSEMALPGGKARYFVVANDEIATIRVWVDGVSGYYELILEPLSAPVPAVTGSGVPLVLYLAPSFPQGVGTLELGFAASKANGVVSATARAVVGLGQGVCGNEVIDGLESCDGMNLAGRSCESEGFPGGTLSCDSACLFDLNGCNRDESCGNGEIEVGESCDGEQLDGRSCMDLGFAGGSLSCDSACAYDTSGCLVGICGNDSVEAGENCDGNDLGGTSCEDLGFAAGTLACDSSCSYDTSACLASVCGNGLLEGGETCDGNELGDGSCEDLGFAGGTLNCGASCAYDTSSCLESICGNDSVEAGEDCDGNDLGGTSCEDLGFTAGTLNCTPACEFDTGECADSCGNGLVDSGEQCDDGNQVDGDCCAADCTYEPTETACEDGQFCQTADTCDGQGSCRAGAVRTCDDGNVCTDDFCDEGANTCFNVPDVTNDPLCSCGNGFVDPGEECDDGNTEDGDCCSATCTYESEECLETCSPDECRPCGNTSCPFGRTCLITECGGPGNNGICVPRAGQCPDEINPVCGCDGLIYENLCKAIRDGAGFASEGPCD